MTPWSQLEGDVADLEGFSAATERALAHGEERAVVLVDLGDAAGPASAAAEARIVRTIRPDDLLGRLGEGRFAVLTEAHSDREAPERVAVRLAARLREPFHLGGTEVDLSPRIGVAFRKGDADTAAGILARAESALR